VVRQEEVDRRVVPPQTCLAIAFEGHGVAALGLEPIVAGWLLQTSRPITSAQIGGAARSADSAGLVIETADSHTASPLGKDASIFGILLALGVLAMTVGLIRAESAGDLRILAATGAAGRTRRALTGATAGSLARLGVLLGAGGAYVVALAWYHRRLGPLADPPYANLLIIALGLPVAATVGAWVLGGRQPPAIARRPIE
jgi:putative ABC transport system permease protein